MIGSVPSNAKLDPGRDAVFDAVTGATDFDLGFAYPNGGAVIVADCIVNGQTLHLAAATTLAAQPAPASRRRPTWKRRLAARRPDADPGGELDAVADATRRDRDRQGAADCWITLQQGRVTRPPRASGARGLLSPPRAHHDRSFGTEEYAANLALGHLGQPRSRRCRTPRRGRARCGSSFPVARDDAAAQALEFCHRLGDAGGRSGAAGSAISNRYPLPADCLRVRFIKGDNRREWAIESGAAAVGGVDVETSILVTNIDAPTVCYTRRVTAVRLWDAMFLTASATCWRRLCATALGRRASSATACGRGAIARSGDAAVDRRQGARRRAVPAGDVLGARGRGGGGFSGRTLRS
jgi:hypothetical protein